MSEEQEASDVEEIKVRLGDEIPVEEVPEQLKADRESPDLVGEFRNLGRQLGETIRAAWQSEERHQVQGEINEGLQTFAGELDKAVKGIRSSSAAQKAKEEATEVKTRVRSGEITDKTKTSLAQGLGWLSEELAKLADQFTPVEKSPTEEEAE